MTWSNLPKSQTDNETIEQAIMRIVAQHETDNTSHMGIGESIDVHRKELVLDHAVGSVLLDKETMSEIKFYTTFESLDMWDITGDVTIASNIGAVLYLEHPFTTLSGLGVQPQIPINFRNTNKDMLFQCLLRTDFDIYNYNGYFGFLFGNTSTSEGFGFQVRNKVLYTYIGIPPFSRSVSHSTIALNIDHIYRVQYIAGERTFYFYVDGVLIDSYILPITYNFEDDGGPQVYFSVNSGASGRALIGNMSASRQI